MIKWQKQNVHLRNPQRIYLHACFHTAGVIWAGFDGMPNVGDEPSRHGMALPDPEGK